MEDKSMEFQLILKELDHADRQIASYLDLQMKILGLVFAFLGTSIGLTLVTEAGKALTPGSLATLLTVISAVGSVGVLQSSINYGIALSYMNSKGTYISSRLQRLLNLQERPLTAIEAFRDGPARRPVMFATAVLGFGILALNAGILTFAWSSLSNDKGSLWFAVLATGLLSGSVVAQLLMRRAMKAVGVL